MMTPDDSINPDTPHVVPAVTQQNLAFMEDLGHGSFDPWALLHHIHEVPESARLVLHADGLFFDGDGTIYDTEEGLYANSDACYARVIRAGLRGHPSLAHVFAEEDPHRQDELFREWWDESRDGRDFRSCLKRGLDGDVKELSDYLERHISSSADEEGSFSVHRQLFLDLVRLVQGNDVAYREMLGACALVPGIARLVDESFHQGLPMAVFSAAPHQNTCRNLEHFRVEYDGRDPERPDKSFSEMFRLIRGDCQKVTKDSEGRPRWVKEGIYEAAEMLKEVLGYRLARRSCVMFGDTMSDVGAAALNGVSIVVIYVPPGEDREGVVESLRRNVALLEQHQNEDLSPMRKLKKLHTHLYIVNSWDQVQVINRGTCPSTPRREWPSATAEIVEAE